MSDLKCVSNIASYLTSRAEWLDEDDIKAISDARAILANVARGVVDRAGDKL